MHKYIIYIIYLEDDPPSTCLSKNDLVENKEYKLELEDNDVKEGHDFFQDLIKKLEKISIAINTNVQIEEKKKLDGIRPNWDKIQEFRNLEKEIKEFTPSIAPKISKLWKSQQLRNMYLFQYGLHNSRNLFYYIDNIKKFVLQKQRAEEKIIMKDDSDTINIINDNNNNNNNDDDDTLIATQLDQISSSKSHHNHNIHHRHQRKKPKWQWEFSFEEILRCQIRTTGVIEQSSNLGPSYDNDIEKQFNLKLRLWDVGGAQNERKKWKYILNSKHDSPDIDCIIFVVNLMSYYKKSWESDKNGLLQSLQLFSCLLSNADTKHDQNYHRINNNNNNNDDDDKKVNNYNNNNLMNIGDPMALARSISQEEYNVCIDNQVKKAMNDIGLFYIIFSDTEGLKQMLEKGISFKSCFNDYNGDNSITDVLSFIENKFRSIIDESNIRTLAKNGKLIKQNSASSIISDNVKTPYLMRTGSNNNKYENGQVPNGKTKLKRTNTVPPGMRMGFDIDEKMNNNNNDNDNDNDNDNEYSQSLSDDIMIEPEKQIEGQKVLKCRFVSVIDHAEMKNVMNEIVKSSFLNKSTLKTVVHSLIDE